MNYVVMCMQQCFVMHFHTFKQLSSPNMSYVYLSNNFDCNIALYVFFGRVRDTDMQTILLKEIIDTVELCNKPVASD
jgi:hypothetical protein